MGKDGKYFERRKRNNVAAKKSRDARKQREDEIAIRASFLEKENSILKVSFIICKFFFFLILKLKSSFFSNIQGSTANTQRRGATVAYFTSPKEILLLSPTTSVFVLLQLFKLLVDSLELWQTKFEHALEH